MNRFYASGKKGLGGIDQKGQREMKLISLIGRLFFVESQQQV
jgi:hypothetical protein